MNISLLVGGLDCFGFRFHNLCEYCNQVPVTCVRAAVLTALFLPSQHPFRMDGGMDGVTDCIRLVSCTGMDQGWTKRWTPGSVNMR